MTEILYNKLQAGNSPQSHKLYSQEILRKMSDILRLPDDFVFIVHLKFYKWKHFTIQLNLEMLQGLTSKELRKPQRPTALHVTTCVFKRYNDLRSTSQSTK